MHTKPITLLVSACVAVALNAATPIGWWTMDELDASGKIPDKSGNDRALSLYGDLYLTNVAVSGMALYNPSDVNIASARFTAPADLRERSISMWLRLEHEDGIYTYDNGNNTYPHLFNNFGGMRVLYGFNSDSRGFTGYVGPTAFEASKWLKPRGIWSHLVITLGEITEGDASATVRVYQDGVLSSEASVALEDGWSVQKSHTCSISGNGGNRPIHGFIDELKVFDVALTPAEVSAEFRSHLNPESVVAHWTMERTEVRGGKTYILDETGRNPLLLKGGAAITTDDPVVGSAALLIPGAEGDTANCATPSNAVQSMTFAAWLWMSDTQAAGNSYPRIADFGTGTFLNSAPAVDALGVTAQYFGGGDSASANNAVATKGRWTHVAVSYDAGCDETGWWQVTKWYRNGNLVKTGDKKYRAATETNYGGIRPSAGFNIGCNGSNRPFAGKLDDIWIFNRPLEDAEVRELYCRAATVRAGADFTVDFAAATLSGQLNPKAVDVFAVSRYGKTTWTQVSGPAATIVAPDSLETEVLLTENGVYTFRLTAQNAFGDVETDDVTVTRADGPAVAPTVTAAVEEPSVAQPAPAYLSATVSGAERIRWSKVSGPGGVYFDDSAAAKAQAFFTCAGTYVLACTAENGGASAVSEVTVTVTGTGAPVVADTGLSHYWNFDEAPEESLSQTRGMSVNGYWLKPSRVGFGIGDIYQEGDHYARFNTNLKTPCADKLTFAYWMYHDDPVDSDKIGTVKFSRVLNSSLVTVQYNNTSDPLSFIVYMTNVPGLGGWKFTSAGLDGANLRNGSVKQRWTHVAIVMDFSEYKGAEMPPKDRVAFYIDGERVACAKIEVDGTPKEGDDYVIRRRTENGANTALGGITTDNRYFPGVLDEVRYYTRALSQDEVRRLAFDFSPMNRAPIVEVPAALKVMQREPVELDGAAYDDGNGTLSSRWEVLSGDADKVVFEDATSPATTVMFKKPGEYVLRLVATDGERETFSRPVTVTVERCGAVILLK